MEELASVHTATTAGGHKNVDPKGAPNRRPRPDGVRHGPVAFIYRAANHVGMAEILAENLSGKTVMGDDGAELGLLYNITMTMKTGQLGHLIVDPGERGVSADFERDAHGHYLVPVANVQAVKDHIVVRR